MDLPVSLLRNRLLRQDLSAFIARSFATLLPATKFEPNWHIDLLAAYLNACGRGEIKRLIVNLPPRSLKSHIVSIAWPAFLLGHNPTQRIVCASYSQRLAEYHARDALKLMHSEWYRQVFANTEIAHAPQTAAMFATTQGGFRLSTSVGGTLTGQGGNVLIVDDPQNSQQAMSRSKRKWVQHWFEHTFASRLDDKRSGAIVLVMQRLHEDDLTGFLLKKGGWEHVAIPAVAEKDEEYRMNDCVYERKAGEAMSTREDAEVLAQVKQELGSHHFAAQYQQQPVPESGGLFKREWLKRFDLAEFRKQWGMD